MLLTQRRNLKKNHNMFNILIKGKFDILIRDAGNFVLYTSYFAIFNSSINAFCLDD